MPRTNLKPVYTAMPRLSPEISTAEMAMQAGISEGRINRLQKAGVIRSARVGRKLVTLRSDFDAYLDGRPAGSDNAGIDYDLLADALVRALGKKLQGGR